MTSFSLSSIVKIWQQKKSNKLPVWATTVTPLSKTIALLMFILLPIAGFYYGMYYQQLLDTQKQLEPPEYIIVKPSPAVSPSGSQPISSPPNGRTSCNTNMDCPAGYICAQAGPIMISEKQHKTCWRKGSPMPL